ncbi:30S ribosomal protein S2 [Arenimonas sp.]|nr:30S ribosomal protein S2 [Candidatus Parcubacteria bacterium]
MTQQNDTVKDMFEAGVHYGTLRASRNPSVKKYVYGTKGTVDIINVEITIQQIEKAKAFITDLKANGKVILFATSKSEVVDLVKDSAIRFNSPFIAGRWVGGLFTNFEIIRKRINRMIDLVSMKEKGELKKYTKKEQSLMDKEVERLEKLFSGVKELTSLPAALLVVDPKKEFIAVEEARMLGIPVIAIANTDCKVSTIDFPIVANDSSRSSVDYILHQLLG